MSWKTARPCAPGRRRRRTAEGERRVIEQLLGDLAPRQFLDQVYTRLPHSRPGGAAGFTSFSGWPAVEAILASKDVDAFLAREGVMWEGGRLPSFSDARRLFGEGHTLVIRSAE